MRKTIFLLFFGFVLVMAGCGGGGGNGSSGTQPPISVSCFPTQVEVGKTSQCSVSPAGTVGSWSVSGPGSINSSGLYTAPPDLSGGTSAVVKFTANDGRTGSATLAIVGLPSPGDIVFLHADNPDANADIYVINADGSGMRRLTTDPLQDITPAWSPDKKRIAFSSNRDHTIQIYVMNADGSDQKRISPQEYSYASDPGWSPDGSKIAFIGQLAENGDVGVAVMNADGSGAVQLTREPCARGCFIPGHPRFSPDGTKIVFDSAKSGNFDVWVMNADGSDQQNLTANSAASDGTASWSPDGRKIAFMSDRNGAFAIYTMNADGSGVFQVTFLPLGDPANLRDVDPSWSPDGTAIVYAGQRLISGVFVIDLYIVPADSGTPRRITSSGLNRYPDWR